MKHTIDKENKSVKLRFTDEELENNIVLIPFNTVFKILNKIVKSHRG